MTPKIILSVLILLGVASAYYSVLSNERLAENRGLVLSITTIWSAVMLAMLLTGVPVTVVVILSTTAAALSVVVGGGDITQRAEMIVSFVPYIVGVVVVVLLALAVTQTALRVVFHLWTLAQSSRR